MRQLVVFSGAILVCAMLMAPILVARAKVEEKGAKAAPKSEEKEGKSKPEARPAPKSEGDAKDKDTTKPKAEETASALEGTKWRVVYITPNGQGFAVPFEFRKGGDLVCGSDKKVSGTWKVDGAMVRMKTKDGAELEGTLKGDKMNGIVAVKAKGKKKSARYKWEAEKEAAKAPAGKSDE